MSGWIGVDFDGTLCKDESDKPVRSMVRRIKTWLKRGIEVRILTARVATVNPPLHRAQMRQEVEEWCLKHIGVRLMVTPEKDYQMLELWDDRAITVQKNTGDPLGVPSRGFASMVDLDGGPD